MLIPHRDTQALLTDGCVLFLAVDGRATLFILLGVPTCSVLSVRNHRLVSVNKQTPSESEEETTTGMCSDTGSLSLKHSDQMIRKLLFLQN